MQKEVVTGRWSEGVLGRRGVLFSLFFFAVLLAYDRSRGSVGAWRFTHWLFDYEHEFVKRGLVGEVFRLLGVDMNYELAEDVSRAVLLALALAFIFLLIRLDKIRERKEFWLLGLLILVSPFTLQHLTNGIGRFDQFGLLLALTALASIASARATEIKLAAVSGLMVIAILIHEASSIAFMPLVMGYWFYRDRDRTSLYAQGICFLLLGFATALTWIYGQAGRLGFDEHLAILAAKSAHAHPDALLVLHAGSVQDNLLLTAHRALTVERLLHHLAMFFFLSPFFWLLGTLIRSLGTIKDGRLLIFLLTSLSPLALYPVGHDHFRWWALAMTNLLLALVLLAIDREAVSERMAAHISRYKVAYWVAIVMALPLGPVLGMESFDFVVELIG